MNPENTILMRMFGCPQGFLGRLGGRVMARTNRNCASWVAGLLDVQPNDKVLEVGFGPGIAIKLLTRLATGGYIFGVDPSEEMVAQGDCFEEPSITPGPPISSGGQRPAASIRVSVMGPPPAI
jgi:SAM-dependent methyltransferase